MGSFDLVIDILLSLIPAYVTATTEGLSLRRRVPISVAFGSKLLVAPVVIARLVLLRAKSGQLDSTWETVPLIIATQVQLCFAVLTTCIPYLYAWSSNLLGDVFLTHLRLAPQKVRKASRPNNQVPLTIQIPRGPDRRYLDPTANAGRHLSVRGSVARSPGVSSLGSSKMIINKQTTFWVEEELNSGHSSLPSRPQTVPTIRESFLED